MFADPERLQQVVINVLSQRGEVFCRGRRRSRSSCAATMGCARIVVSDHGVGIRSEFLPYVFDRLRQGANTGNRGLGLGLWIVRDIVERHGGTVTAASDGEGKGATFTVTLPLRAQAEVPGGVRWPCRSPRRGKEGYGETVSQEERRKRGERRWAVRLSACEARRTGGSRRA